MKTVGRIATEEERERLHQLHDRWEMLTPWFEFDDAIDWEIIETELDTPPAQGYQRIHPDDLAALRGGEGPKSYVHVGRGYLSLPIRSVLEAERLLRARADMQRRLGTNRLPRHLKLSYEAIATACGLPRDRVKQIERLIESDWNLRENHPQFPARAGFVNLPTEAELRRLRLHGLR
jgi:hypothetical protein